jgi:hypothetical protein
MSIVKLPNHVLCVLHSYLCLRPATMHNNRWYQYSLECLYDFSGEVSTDSHWRSFVNASKSFRELKTELIYLSLNKIKSKQFVKDKTFREFIQKQFLKNPEKQLALHLDGSVTLSFTNIAKQLTKIFRGSGKFFTGIENLHFLMLSNIKNIPVSEFHNISYILFKRCTFLETNPVIHSELVSFKDMNEILLRLISFPKLKGLFFHESTVKGISCLNNCLGLRTLCFEECKIKLEQPPISTFDCKSLNKLYLSTALITHFTNYSKVKIVKLSSCTRSDLVAAFESCNFMNLTAYSRPAPPRLLTLETLILSECRAINRIDISTFPVLKRLQVFNCRKLTKLVVNGTSLKLLQLWGKLSSLETVVIQTPSLKKCYLEHLESKNAILFFEKFKIPLMIANEVKAKISFVRQY